jgi:hypothetical protein
MFDAFFTTLGARVALAFLLGCLLGLLGLTTSIAAGRKFDYPVYHRCLYIGAALVLGFAAWTVGRIAPVLAAGDACYKPFRGELILLVIFWTLIPPMWFFTEYYGFDCKAVPPPAPRSLKEHLEALRAYADFASKIWAALAALLLGVAAIMFQK